MSKKPRRLPNKFGCVTLLKGNRRKPYQAKTPILGTRSNGTPIQKSLGCYATYNEAYAELLEYHKRTSLPEQANITFAEMYEKAIEEKQRGVKKASEGTLKFYRSAFNNLKDLHDMQISDIRSVQLQSAFDKKQKLSHSSLDTMKLVCHLVFKYACKYDLADKDYSKFIDLRKSPPKADKDKYFTDEEMSVLKANTGDPMARALLVMIYSGFRIRAYDALEINREEGYFKGGIKTEASKDRIVPIHPAILPFLDDFKMPPYQTFLKDLKKFEQKHGLRELSPHATRHTFSYLLDKAGTDDITSKLLMGHALNGDIHTSVYKHRSFEQLKNAIEALPY